MRRWRGCIEKDHHESVLPKKKLLFATKRYHNKTFFLINEHITHIIVVLKELIFSESLRSVCLHVASTVPLLALCVVSND